MTCCHYSVPRNGSRFYHGTMQRTMQLSIVSVRYIYRAKEKMEGNTDIGMVLLQTAFQQLVCLQFCHQYWNGRIFQIRSIKIYALVHDGRRAQQRIFIYWRTYSRRWFLYATAVLSTVSFGCHLNQVMAGIQSIYCFLAPSILKRHVQWTGQDRVLQQNQRENLGHIICLCNRTEDNCEAWKDHHKELTFKARSRDVDRFTTFFFFFVWGWQSMAGMANDDDDASVYYLPKGLP